jgi:SPP1 family predicted phage head-tail adaptor
MRLDDVVTLIDGETETDVFANLSSVGQAEAYQAAALGLKPSAVFTIWTAEYAKQSRLKHEDQPYKVIRTYKRQDGFTELHCEVKLGG